MKKSNMFIFGVAIGSVLGLLFAPKAGEETRKNVSKASKKAVEWGKKRAEMFHDKHKDYIDGAADLLQKSMKRLKTSFRIFKKHTVEPVIEKPRAYRSKRNRKNGVLKVGMRRGENFRVVKSNAVHSA